ncbi:recombinase family protein [Roseomonas marmotae]|uniref:recombinase family protein n=1 Tax=Roseomonas marmotae TaxID=2768161 RepID=UPI001AD6CE11|nr:recombinase family protein [Roseomonas marmotae]QTI78337.1 recombinase family protein [Roseomonas marmotae]
MPAPTQDFVPYLRVSTDRQGRSGLGLEAQQAAIAAFIAQTPGAHLLDPPYIEVESGRKDDRPELAAAMERCRKTGATLLIAKLDRLARDAHFLLGLQKAGVEFVAADMPHATRLTIGILAVVAEEEARMISARTKAALAAAKARGVKLGGVRPGQRLPDAEVSAQARKAGTATLQMRAERKSRQTGRRIAAWVAQGESLAGIARALNEAGERAHRGGLWTATAVRRALLKAAE